MYLPDGNNEMVFSDDDLVNLVDRNMGSDVSDYIKGLIEERNNLLNSVNEELTSYESDLEVYESLVLELRDSLYDLQKYVFNNNRLNKDKVVKLLNVATNILKNNGF